MSLPRFAGLIALGVTAFYGWSRGFSAAYYEAWTIAYAPDVPSRTWHYAVVVSLCLAIGAVFGALVPLVSRRQRLRSYLAFVFGIALAALYVAYRHADGLSTFIGHSHNVGTYAFLAGSAIGAYLFSMRVIRAV
jgi:zinc transporter ZupT